MRVSTSAKAAMAALAAMGLAVAGIGTAAANTSNGTFDSSAVPWWSYGVAALAVTDGALCATTDASNRWDAGVGDNSVTVATGEHEISFDVTGEGTFKVVVQIPDGGSEVLGQEFAVTGTQSFNYTFTSDQAVSNAKVLFEVGGNAAGHTVCLDNISVLPTGNPGPDPDPDPVTPPPPAGVNLVSNGTFDDGTAPWWATGNVTSNSVVDGQWCVGVPGGTSNPWDVIVGYNDITLPAGEYTLAFDASGTGGPMRAIVGVNGPPYTVYNEINAAPPTDGDNYTRSFTMDSEVSNLQVAFQLGGSSTPWTFCVDNVSLLGAGSVDQYMPETGPRVRVNQFGYELDGPKRATLVTEATDPVAWSLVDSSDNVVHSGVTNPAGIDASANLNVHTIDFSGVDAAGTYTLQADGETSYPFVVGTELYNQLRYDALNYFYLARSGIEIEASIVGEEYARAAGHVSQAGGSDINQGDYNVACQPASESQTVYGEPWTCDYTLDVVGGWYDAGDHGKYVVNGGIATYQLLALYERTLRDGAAGNAALGDNTLNLPETGNGVPDVLDEARWELEFMMSMMVPQGEELEGMVHHKIHDYGWTGLPLLPANSGQARYLHRPSTAATLNLAATAAQGARLFEEYDPAFAAELLDKARIAWAAALANPALYAPAADGANGGGPYDDNDVTDEFYWAAAELYLTTGEAEFKDYLLTSPHHTGPVFTTEGFHWGSVAALGRMDLATVASAIPDRQAIADSVVAGAELVLAMQQAQPFGQAYAGDDEGTWAWGSNSSVLNNMVVLATAYDISGDVKFLDAVRESMDYLMGRNALNLSYITGYGTVYSQNQHSRWFAAQLNGEYPHPPVGSIAGGPNSDYGTWDPVISSLYADNCAPQWCYVDDIQAWSVNEITVNWNSALSWVAAFLAAPQATVDLTPVTDGGGTGGGGGTVTPPTSGGPGSGITGSGSRPVATPAPSAPSDGFPVFSGDDDAAPSPSAEPTDNDEGSGEESPSAEPSPSPTVIAAPDTPASQGSGFLWWILAGVATLAVGGAAIWHLWVRKA